MIESVQRIAPFSRPTDIYPLIPVRFLLTKMSTTSNDKSIGYYVAGFPNQDIFEEVIEALVKERWQIIQELYFPSYLSDERARCNGFDERATQWSTHVLYIL